MRGGDGLSDTAQFPLALRHALITRRIAERPLAGTLALFFLANSLLLLSWQVPRLFLLDEAGYGDSYVLYDVLHFQNTGEIYGDLSQPPYLPAQYSPLMYMLYSLPGNAIASETQKNNGTSPPCTRAANFRI